MRLTFLGSGGVWAAPVHGCACTACSAAHRDPARARAPASALLEVAGLRLLIDAGRTDLVERFPPGSLDGVLLTHLEGRSRLPRVGTRSSAETQSAAPPSVISRVSDTTRRDTIISKRHWQREGRGAIPAVACAGRW